MLTVNISELVLTIASFFLLLFALDRLLYRPLLRFMEDRQARIEAGLRAGSDAEQALERAKGESESRLADVRKQAAQTVTQAALEDRKSLTETARRLSREAESAAAAAQAKVAELRGETAAGLDALRPQLAELLADRLLGR